MIFNDHTDERSRPFARTDGGFTLIELLVVITILGILAAIVVFAVKGIGDKGRTNAIATDGGIVRTAEEANCAQHGTYATIDELIANKLLASEPVYSAVALGDENKCGTGPSSSFALYNAATPTEIAPGAGATPVGAPTGQDPSAAAPSDVAVDATANRIYVVSKTYSDVTVIDGKTDQVVTTIDVSGAVSSPTRIAVNPSNGKVYVGGTGIALIDTSNATQPNAVTQISGFVGTVAALAVDPDNGDVYVSNGASTLGYIAKDATSFTAIGLTGIPCSGPGVTGSTCNATLVSAGAGADFAFDPAHHKVYTVKNGTSATAPAGLITIAGHAPTVTTFATNPAATASSAGTRPLKSIKGSLAVAYSGNKIYLLGTRVVPFAPNASGIATVSTVLVVDGDSHTVDVIDDAPSATANFAPNVVIYNPAAGAVFVFSSGSSSSACSIAGKITRIVGTSSTGQAPVCAPPSGTAGNPAHEFAVIPNINRFLVAQLAGGVLALDGTTLLSESPLATAHKINAMAVNARTDKIYAVDTAAGTITVLQPSPSA